MIYEREEDDLGYSAEALHTCPFCGRWDGAHLFGCPVREPSTFEEGTFEECPSVPLKGSGAMPSTAPSPA
jgi:hypothetical protein